MYIIYFINNRQNEIVFNLNTKAMKQSYNPTKFPIKISWDFAAKSNLLAL